MKILRSIRGRSFVCGTVTVRLSTQMATLWLLWPDCLATNNYFMQLQLFCEYRTLLNHFTK